MDNLERYGCVNGKYLVIFYLYLSIFFVEMTNLEITVCSILNTTYLIQRGESVVLSTIALKYCVLHLLWFLIAAASYHYFLKVRF